MHLFFGILSFVITIVGYWILSQEIKKARTNLPISSWILWSAINILLLTALFVGNSKLPQIMQMISYTVGTLSITYLVYRKGTWEWTHLDTGIAAIAGLSMMLWAMTGIPLVAVVLCLVALTVSSVPMWRALLVDPKSQSEAPWYLWWVGGVLGVCAIETWTYVDALMPVWILIMQSATALLIGLPDLQKQGENVRGALIATFVFLFVMSTLIYMMIATMPHLKAAYSTNERATIEKARTKQ